ncbi:MULTISPECIES: hypothetical protein [unclassified Methylobacterium]|uniref:hypothetical protein n=1 Tax=unclassified Methylobacterium TaxID=2615210 RepID=UPI0011C1D6C0|nr:MULTISPECIES: hypothetical protein [unclassified Methylobacterium]QEE41001.1 hypothetical protein FVA80_20515 [Methylobacterium sp. WL1]TXN52793.1 hypothetical protein FV241_29075 [Methylobacterium sp. WL2]
MAHITLDEAKPYLLASGYETARSTGPITRRGPAMVALAFGCGLQRMEIVALRRRHWRPGGEDVVDVDLADETVDGSPVKSRRRILPVAPYLGMMIDAYLAAWPGIEPDDRLFRNDDGNPATVTSVMVQMRNPARRSGVRLTLPAFAAAFVTSVGRADDEHGLVEYLVGAMPPDGSRWADAHPATASLRTMFKARLAIWQIDRSFWHAPTGRGARHRDEEGSR